MDWPTVVAALRRHAHVDVEKPRWCGVSVELDGRREKIAVWVAPSDPAAIMLSMGVCPLMAIEEREALRYNRSAVSWSLGLEGELYVLERALGAAGLDEAALLAAMQATVREAHRLRALAAPVALDGDLSRLVFWFQ